MIRRLWDFPTLYLYLSWRLLSFSDMQVYFGLWIFLPFTIVHFQISFEVARECRYKLIVVIFVILVTVNYIHWSCGSFLWYLPICFFINGHLMISYSLTYIFFSYRAIPFIWMVFFFQSLWEVNVCSLSIFNQVFQRKYPVIEMVKMAVGQAAAKRVPLLCGY